MGISDMGTSRVRMRAYGAMHEFDSVEEAQEFYSLFIGPGFGFVDIFRDIRTHRWCVAQYVATPFTLAIKKEGERFPLSDISTD